MTNHIYNQKKSIELCLQFIPKDDIYILYEIRFEDGYFYFGIEKIFPRYARHNRCLAEDGSYICSSDSVIEKINNGDKYTRTVLTIGHVNIIRSMEISRILNAWNSDKKDMCMNRSIGGVTLMEYEKTKSTVKTKAKIAKSHEKRWKDPESRKSHSENIKEAFIKNPVLRDNISKRMSGENNPNWGKKRPNETRRKISESNMGQSSTKEARINMMTSGKSSNTSGHRGVRYATWCKKWYSYITNPDSRKQETIGYYSKFEDAVKSRLEAEKHILQETFDIFIYDMKKKRCNGLPKSNRKWVHWDKNSKKWSVRVRDPRSCKKKYIYVGRFSNEEDAIKESINAECHIQNGMFDKYLENYKHRKYREIK